MTENTAILTQANTQKSKSYTVDVKHLYVIITSHFLFWACNVSPVPPDVSSDMLVLTLDPRSSAFLSTYLVYAEIWCSPHLPRYTVFTGSTARAVATRSSALCLRPLTMTRPSIFPTTKIRLPYTKQGTHRGDHYALSVHIDSKTERAGRSIGELKLRQMPYCKTYWANKSQES